MIRVRQVRISVLKDSNQALKEKIAKKVGVSFQDILAFTIHKKSIDARDKNNIVYSYEVDVSFKNEEKILKKNTNKDVFLTPKEEYKVPDHGKKKYNGPIIIVGSGPAGLFAAYLLAEKGYKPIVMERGQRMEERILTVESFWKTNQLNPESNVQFGEGGAGTFSDGKLNTLVSDSEFRGKKVLETFVKFGAPKEILYEQKPHIGTDVLRSVVVNMRNAIIKMGGSFLYETCLTNVYIENNKLSKIEVNHKEIMDCENLILAIGHSARDTFSMLYDAGVTIEAKPFAIGVRVEHLQEEMNKSQYGKFYRNLPPASYKLTYKASNGRGVYSFCMCPGGYVVNASSEKNRLAINGMSYANRNSKNANSAIVVTVTPKDFGTFPLDGLEFQRNLEAQAYKLGKGSIPIQLYKDYQENKISTSFLSIKPEMKGSFRFANLNDLFPSYINDSIKEAIFFFEHKIKNFACADMLLSGIESRTSSPVKIIRDEHFTSNVVGIYPCGEGAGYAGGITTSAMDGLKVAEEIIKTYAN